MALLGKYLCIFFPVSCFFFQNGGVRFFVGERWEEVYEEKRQWRRRTRFSISSWHFIFFMLRIHVYGDSTGSFCLLFFFLLWGCFVFLDTSLNLISNSCPIMDMVVLLVSRWGVRFCTGYNYFLLCDCAFFIANLKF